jgi:hypothetical protein
MNYTLYSTTNGRILSVLECPAASLELYLSLFDGSVTAIQGTFDGETQRIDLTAVPITAVNKSAINYSVDKTTISANGFDFVIIGDLPIGTVATFESESHDVVGTYFEFSTDVPGIYNLDIWHPLHLSARLTITAQ